MIRNTIFAIVALSSLATSQANGIGCPWATYPGPYMQSYGSLTNPNVGFVYGNLLLWEYNESSRPNSSLKGTKNGENSGINAALSREADVADAIAVNIATQCNDQLTAELSAIVNSLRMVENGGPNLEFGYIAPENQPEKGNTYRKQAGQAAFSAVAQLRRYMNGDDRQYNPATGTWSEVSGPKRDMPSQWAVMEDGMIRNTWLDFIDHWGDRWCPYPASNDPNGLNKNWKPNMKNKFLQNKINSPLTPDNPDCAFK